jgi:hypothetical protein
MTNKVSSLILSLLVCLFVSSLAYLTGVWRLLESRLHPPPAPPVKGVELKPPPLAGTGRVRGNSTDGRSFESTTTLMRDRICPMLRFVPAWLVVCLVMSLGLFSAPADAMEFSPIPNHSPFHPSDQSIVEARAGYMWGTNQIQYRNGDNGLIPAGRKDISLDSPIFGLQAGTFAVSDLAVRAQAWINIPLVWRSNFLFDGQSLGWDTQSNYFEADLSAIYHFGLGHMPYTAAIVGGYRFYKVDYESHRITRWSDSFHDHFQIHVPYFGVYYSHTDLANSLVRLEILFSPILFCGMEANQSLNNQIAPPPNRTLVNIPQNTQLDGQSYIGQWADVTFEWSKRLGKNVLLGASSRFNFINPVAGARAQHINANQELQITHYTMDMRYWLLSAGLTFTYTF